MGRSVVVARAGAAGRAMSASVTDIRRLLWGTEGCPQQVFHAWSQGFTFSPHEPTALVQSEGGPCAVLAAVQAFIVKSLLAQGETERWLADQNTADRLLVNAVADIICQAVDDFPERVYQLAMLPTDGQPLDDYLGSDFLHDELTLLPLDTAAEVRHFLTTQVGSLRGTYGVLLVLYSVIASRGPTNIKAEMNDPTEPLIDSEHGYGGQSLINLMLVGRAVGNVWDGDRNIDGIVLRGIERQGQVGFLTVLERSRHCEVGTCLKSPRHPVWVLGSETHLTVLFSTERRLAGDWSAAEIARRVFRQFDPDGGGFVSKEVLPALLAALGMTADAEFTEVLLSQLDPDDYGVVLESTFLKELCPAQDPTPDTFPLFHYNGLVISCPLGKVKYRMADATLGEDLGSRSYETHAPADILGCLQTKWPGIELKWKQGGPPSLN